ncbi:MAG: hypothetical protein RIS47_2015 [Bacteroidota bacterium]|jgi:peroxiredoxin
MKHVFFFMLATVLAASSWAQGYQVGDEATDFSLKNVDNKMVSLAGLSGAKGAIVVFTCNHCPFSVLYEDRIVALDKMFKAKGYPVVAINPNDEAAYPEDAFDKMIVRAKEKGFTFPYLRDESQDIAKAYGAQKTPHVYLLQKEGGKFVVKYIGAIDNNSKEPNAVTEKYVENAVAELLAGKAVSKPNTKAIGCGVKYKN